MTLVNLVLDDDAPDGFITAQYQVGLYILTVRQNPEAGRSHAEGYEDVPPEQSATPLANAEAHGPYISNTPNVGWLVWSSTFVLAEYLLKRTWTGLRVLELGAGTGLLGMALAKHGAHVTITDLPHITALTRQNVALNFGTEPLQKQPQVADYQWGLEEGVDLGTGYDAIVAADCVYEPQYYPDFISALNNHLASQGQVYCCYKLRKLRQEQFDMAAEKAGWHVEVVSDDCFEEGYRQGEYRLLVLSKDQAK